MTGVFVKKFSSVASVTGAGVDTADRNSEDNETKKNLKASINEFDGLVHNDDGSRTDPTTGAVVNSDVQMKSNRLV